MPTEATGLPAVGAEIANKYRIESILGQGSTSAVFAARNLMTGKHVAIKWLLPEHARTAIRERMLREARMTASIDHPNVVDIYDVGEHDGGLFLVMEYLRGKTLSTLLAERGRIDPDEAIALIAPAMRGVHAAHLAGIVHRDLKAENIVLHESEGKIIPKVLDFGISKVMGSNTIFASPLTVTGVLLGTPHYMALEQIDGSNAVDARTDVHAFGVLLYRALTGQFPFDGDNLVEVVLAIATGTPLPMHQLRPDLPPNLDAAIARALSRERDQRFTTVEQFADTLVQLSTAHPLDAVFQAFDSQAPFFPEESGAAVHEAPSLHRLPNPPTNTLAEVAVGAAGTRAPASKHSQRFRNGLVTAAALVALGLVCVLGVRQLHSSTGLVSSALPGAAQRINAPTLSPAAISAATSLPIMQPTAPEPRTENLPITPPEDSPSVIASVQLELDVSPTSARAMIDGVPITLPFYGHFHKDTQPHVIEVSADGYLMYKRIMQLDRNHTLRIALERNAQRLPQRKHARHTTGQIETKSPKLPVNGTPSPSFSERRQSAD